MLKSFKFNKFKLILTISSAFGHLNKHIWNHGRVCAFWRRQWEVRNEHKGTRRPLKSRLCWITYRITVEIVLEGKEGCSKPFSHTRPLRYRCTVRVMGLILQYCTFYRVYTKDALLYMARKFMLQPLHRYNLQSTEQTVQTWFYVWHAMPFCYPYTVKIGLPFSRPQPGCHLLNSPCTEII